MVKAYTPFVAQACQRLAPLGEVRARAMFGGWGVYLGDLMFALVAEEVLYFNVDEQTRPYFEGAGARPFQYHRPEERRSVQMSYWEAPEAALEDEEALCEWARLAVAAAGRARASKSTPRKTRKKKAKRAARKKRG